MTFRANNITANGGMNTFLTLIESDMINAGWVSVTSKVAANFTANAGNTTTNTQILMDVLKSPGTNNAIAADWFVYLGTDLATNGSLYVSMSQAFNAATNLITNYILCNVTATTTLPYANGFCSNANTTNAYFSNTTVGTGTQTANGSNARVLCLNSTYMANTANSNGFNYYYSVTIDRLIMAVANVNTLNTGPCFYLGTYDSFMPLTIDAYPIVMANLAALVLPSNINGLSGGAPNEPVFIAQSIVPAGDAGNFFFKTQFSWNNLVGGVTADSYLGGNQPFARLPIMGTGGNAQNTPSGFRGLFRDCMVTPLPSGRGDLAFWTFNGTQYNATCFGAGTAIYNSGIATSYGPYVLQV